MLQNSHKGRLIFPLMERLKTNLPVPLSNIHSLDVVMFLWMTRRKHLLLWAQWCRYLSHTADGFAYPLIGLICWYRGGHQGQALVFTMVLAFALERPLYLLLKKGLKRNRPAAALPNFNSFIIPSDQFSFPSGHTSGAFAIATGLALYFPQFAYVAYLWAALIGFSRVTLGVHFPSDTLAGALMGSLITVTASYGITQ